LVLGVQFLIRAEKSSDRSGVFFLNAAAFETEAEAKLVDFLRDLASPFISLVVAAVSNLEHFHPQPYVGDCCRRLFYCSHGDIQDPLRLPGPVPR
jgi:hypothetical protein